MIAAVGLCSACVTPGSSAWTPGPPRSPAAAPARVVFVADPPGAEQVGIVEAHGPRPGVTLEALVAELGARGASVGADVVRVDRFATRYELVPETYTDVCGTETYTDTEVRTVSRTDPDGSVHVDTETVTVTKERPKECTGTREVEAAVLSLVGRAFRTRGGPP